MSMVISQVGVDTLNDELYVTMYLGETLLLRFNNKGNLISTFKLDPIIVTALDESVQGVATIILNMANKKALIFKKTDSVLYEAEFVKK
jgi:hypothetical protein